MKSKIMALLVLSALNCSAVLKADEVVLSVISKPTLLNEGTQTELSAAQIAELKTWARNTKNDLVELLDSAQYLSTSDKLERLKEGVKAISMNSAPQKSELLMRYILNRALAVEDILEREAQVDDVGMVDVKLYVLNTSIQMALDYYDKDVDVLTKKNKITFASFGGEYFQFLSEINKSIIDASAQYQIQKVSLEWLQWDLYRDLENVSFAYQINGLNNELKTFPENITSDSQYLFYVRKMKKMAEHYKLNSLVSNSQKTPLSSFKIKAVFDKSPIKVGDVVRSSGAADNIFVVLDTTYASYLVGYYYLSKKDRRENAFRLYPEDTFKVKYCIQDLDICEGSEIKYETSNWGKILQIKAPSTIVVLDNENETRSYDISDFYLNKKSHSLERMTR